MFGPFDSTPPDDSCGQCFTCRMTLLGFDLQQQELVIELMLQAHMAGVVWMAFRDHGLTKAQQMVNLLIEAGAGEMTASEVNQCMEHVMGINAMPVSPEVHAAMLRDTHNRWHT